MEPLTETRSALDRARAECGDHESWRLVASDGQGDELPIEIYLRRIGGLPIGLLLHVPSTDVALLIDASWSRSKRFASRGDNGWRAWGKW